MRPRLGLGAVAAVALAAVLAASAAASSPRGTTLARAAERTALQPTLAFDLTAQIETRGAVPSVLHAHGALGRDTARVALKVADGPSADERTDGAFLYLRSPGGDLWVREPLAALPPDAPELRLLHALSPRTLVLAAARARDLRRSDGGRVYHGVLPYADRVVSDALAGLESGRQYRRLRLTAWVSREGRVVMLLLGGRTADGSSTFLLALTLGGFGEPVSVRPPRAGSFVDLGLGRLSE